MGGFWHHRAPEASLIHPLPTINITGTSGSLCYERVCDMGIVHHLERSVENKIVRTGTICLLAGGAVLGLVEGVAGAHDLATGNMPHSASTVSSDQGHATISHYMLDVGQRQLSGFQAHVTDGSAHQSSQTKVGGKTITWGAYGRAIQPDEVANGQTTPRGVDVDVSLCLAGGKLPAELSTNEKTKQAVLTVQVPASMLTYCTKVVSENFITVTTGLNDVNDAVNRNARDKVYNSLDTIITDNSQDLAVEKCAPIAWANPTVEALARAAVASDMVHGVSLARPDLHVTADVYFGSESPAQPSIPTQTFPREPHKTFLDTYADKTNVTVTAPTAGTCEQVGTPKWVDAQGNTVTPTPTESVNP